MVTTYQEGPDPQGWPGRWIAVLGRPALLAGGSTEAAAVATLKRDLLSNRQTPHLFDVGDDGSTERATASDMVAGLEDIDAYVVAQGIDLRQGEQDREADAQAAQFDGP
ncbi:hypothetical protein [Streptomyces celluloflavus]|uniref:hypothetical protein n=1 Tax=Streptomyces celluloflavus TaxID=58344 RepID=UPI003698F090